MFSTRDRADTAKLLAEYYQEELAEQMKKNPKRTIRRKPVKARRARMRVVPRKITVRRRVTKIRVRKNPVGKFFIRAATGKTAMFYRQSTQSFIDRKADATAYKAKGIATRVARSILDKLPGSIRNLTIVT